MSANDVLVVLSERLYRGGADGLFQCGFSTSLAVGRGLNDDIPEETLSLESVDMVRGLKVCIICPFDGESAALGSTILIDS